MWDNLLEKMITEQNIVIFGRKGCGKTSWIYHLIKDNPDELFMIYDHFDEYNFEGAEYHYSIDNFWSGAGYSKKQIFRGEINPDDFFNLCIAVGNCVVIYDEIDMVCSPSYISNPLYRIIHYGRHLKVRNKIVTVRLVGASRRPANVSRDLTSQADKVIIFKVTEPRDLKYIELYTTSEHAKMANKLDRLEYIVYPSNEEVF